MWLLERIRTLRSSSTRESQVKCFAVPISPFRHDNELWAMPDGQCALSQQARQAVCLRAAWEMVA